MNPITNTKNQQKLNARELELGQTGTKTSWHEQYKDSAWVFVGGLPYDLTEGDILAVFSQYGEIVNINLVRDKQTGKSKGFAFICYEDQRSTVLAVDNLNAIKLLNRTIRVDHVHEYRIPKEFGDEDEVTLCLRMEGCAPGSSLVPAPQTADTDSVPAKKSKKDKHKKEKKKSKKKKHKKSKKSSSESESESPVVSDRTRTDIAAEIKQETVDPAYSKAIHMFSANRGHDRSIAQTRHSPNAARGHGDGGRNRDVKVKRERHDSNSSDSFRRSLEVKEEDPRSTSRDVKVKRERHDSSNNDRSRNSPGVKHKKRRSAGSDEEMKPEQHAGSGSSRLGYGDKQKHPRSGGRDGKVNRVSSSSECDVVKKQAGDSRSENDNSRSNGERQTNQTSTSSKRSKDDHERHAVELNDGARHHSQSKRREDFSRRGDNEDKHRRSERDAHLERSVDRDRRSGDSRSRREDYDDDVRRKRSYANDER